MYRSLYVEQAGSAHCRKVGMGKLLQLNWRPDLQRDIPQNVGKNAKKKDKKFSGNSQTFKQTMTVSLNDPKHTTFNSMQESCHSSSHACLFQPLQTDEWASYKSQPERRMELSKGILYVTNDPFSEGYRTSQGQFTLTSCLDRLSCLLIRALMVRQ